MQLEKLQRHRLLIGIMIVAVVILESVMLTVYWRLRMLREQAEQSSVVQRENNKLNLPVLPMQSIRHDYSESYPSNRPGLILTQQQNTGVVVPMYTTSSVKVQYVGGGSSAASGASGNINSSVSNPTPSTSALVVPSLAWASARALTAQNTISAERELIRANSAGNINNEPKTGLPPEPYPDDPQEPIGPAWILLAFAAIYGVVLTIRKRIVSLKNKQ